MTDEDEDGYRITVALEHPDRPKVELRLSWPEEKPVAYLAKVASDLTVYASEVGRGMVERIDGGSDEAPA